MAAGSSTQVAGAHATATITTKKTRFRAKVARIEPATSSLISIKFPILPLSISCFLEYSRETGQEALQTLEKPFE
jgi:hypothetical protein